MIVLLNKPLNCTSVSLPLFSRELDTLHFGDVTRIELSGSNGGIRSEENFLRD